MTAPRLFVGLLIVGCCAFLLAMPGLVHAQNCTLLDPRQQVTENTTHDLGVAARTVFKVGSVQGSYKHVTEKEVKNVYDKYPSADTIVLRDKLTYLFCTTLHESSLSADRKLHELHAFMRTLHEVSAAQSRQQDNHAEQRGDGNEMSQRNAGSRLGGGPQRNELKQVGNNNRGTQVND